MNRAMRLLVLIPMIMLVVLLPVLPAHAQTVVTDPDCTRAGIEAAIAATPAGGTITFACAAPAIVFDAEISITKAITITGGDLIFDGAGVTRFFNVGAAGNLTLQTLTLQNGFTTGGDGGAIIVTGGTLTVNASTFDGNTADEPVGVGSGGAIHIADGMMIANNSTFTNNFAGEADGGAINAVGNSMVTVTGSNFRANTADDGGGVISIGGTSTLTINGGTYDNNVALGGGSAGLSLRTTGEVIVSNASFLNHGDAANISSSIRTDTGLVRVNNSYFAGNYGDEGSAIEIIGAVGIINSSTFENNYGAPIVGTNNGTVEVNGSTFRNNTSEADGAGVFVVDSTLTLTNTNFENNTGSGVSVWDIGPPQTVQMTRTNFRGNSNDNIPAGGPNDGTDLDDGSAINVRDGDAPTIIVQESAIENNGGSAAGSAIQTAGANLTLRQSTIQQNSVTAIDNTGALTIEDSTIRGNTGDLAGAIRNTGSGSLNLFATVIVDNTGGIYNSSGGSVTATETCFATNGDSFVQASSTSVNLTNSWWGSPTGPSGIGPGTGDGLQNPGGGAVAFEPFVSQVGNFTPAGRCQPVAATFNPDFYSISLMETLMVDAASGLLVNDLDYVPNTVQIDPNGLPEFAELIEVFPDGSFNYRSIPNPERTVDGFRYTVLDSASNRVGGGLVCISITDIVMQVPPTQTAEVGVPRVIPGVAVQDLRNPNSNGNVQVRLTVNNGTLQVDPNLVNQGAVDFDPTASDECLDIINQSETAAADDTIETMRSTGAQFQRMSFQMATVTAEGNGTANLELEGPRLDVNLVLTTLIYTPFAEGVDILNIFAVDTVDGGLAFGSVTIIVGAQVDNVAVTNDDRDNAVVGPVPGSDTSLTIPLGPMTLFEISQLPNTIIRGEAPAGTVTDGDVFVRVVATNGTFRVEPAQIGDQFLLEQGVFNGAEVFGLTVTGATVPALNGTVSVCLRGFGDFYYRDVTGMPRVTVALPTTTDNGFTCAEIPNSGTIVLVSNGQAPPPVQPQTVPAAQVATLPDGCMVTTNAIINLREGPGTSNTIIRPIPYDVTLTAFEQSGNWYYVDYLGLRGWLSATYVTPDDIC